MKMKRLLSMMLLGIMTVSMLAGCGGGNNESPANEEPPVVTNPEDNTPDTEEDTSLQEILDKGELILGLDDSFPPMGFLSESGEIIGFDIDVARAVCEKLGVELKIQPIAWSSNQLELDSHNIDCIWNGMSVTEARAATMNLSIPYMKNHMALVVKPDSGIASIADMEGKNLALQSGSSAEDVLDGEDGDVLRSIIANRNGFDDNLQALLDLESNASDAVLMDDVVANYLITVNAKDLIVLGDFLQAEDYAIGFRKADIALTNAVNDALRALAENGTLAEISNNWFGEDLTVVS